MADNLFLKSYCMFLACSFLGWIVESAYKTIIGNRGFVNSGVLRGPIVPIYGFGALLIAAFDRLVQGASSPVKVLVSTALCALFEYAVSLLFEKAFKVRLWDYSTMRHNLKGRVCLSFTCAWALLATIYVFVLKDALDEAISAFLNLPFSAWAMALAAVALAVDTVLSLTALHGAVYRIPEILLGKRAALIAQVRARSRKVSRRILSAYDGALNAYVKRLCAGLIDRSRLEADGGNISKAICVLINQPSRVEDVGDADFLLAVEDVAAHPMVRGMASIRHHDDSLLKHSLTVSLAAFYIARAFNADEVATARGALLHDFFLYDWRDGTKRRHATRHARTALKNAKAYFSLDPVEEDIIVTHMWPIGGPFYSFHESFLVSSVDKIVSAKEAVLMLRQAHPRAKGIDGPSSADECRTVSLASRISKERTYVAAGEEGDGSDVDAACS